MTQTTQTKKHFQAAGRRMRRNYGGLRILNAWILINELSPRQTRWVREGYLAQDAFWSAQAKKRGWTFAEYAATARAMGWR